jgi:hypothetical protein
MPILTPSLIQSCHVDAPDEMSVDSTVNNPGQPRFVKRSAISLTLLEKEGTMRTRRRLEDGTIYVRAIRGRGNPRAMRTTVRTLTKFRLMIGIGIALVLVSIRIPTASAGSDLKLAPDLSFIDDSSANFPIEAADPADGTISADRPTVVFFGTSHCWNTNREAERVVTLFPKYRDRVHFVIVDLNHVSPAQRSLVSNYYGGYIPTVVIFDRNGKVVYDRAGETAGPRRETHNLAALIDSAVDDSGSK